MGSQLPILEQTNLAPISPFFAVYGDFNAATNNFIRRGNVVGPPGYYLAWDSTAVNIVDGNTVTALAPVPNNKNLCYYAITNAGVVTVNKINISTGVITQIYQTSALASAYVNHMVALSETEMIFAITSDTQNLSPMGVYRSNDGLTASAIGNGNASATLYGVWALAYSTVLSSGKTRIYSQHDRNGNAVLSYTDDLGATWVSVANSAFNAFSSGSWGFISMVPINDGSTDLYYSAANGGGGIQTSYIEGGVVTINPQMTNILNSNFIEVAFAVQNGYRIIVPGSGTTVYLSTNKGNSWTALSRVLPNNAIGKKHTFSVLPTLDIFIVATSAGSSLSFTSNYGTDWLTFSLPNVAKAVAFVQGRS